MSRTKRRATVDDVYESLIVLKPRDRFSFRHATGTVVVTKPPNPTEDFVWLTSPEGIKSTTCWEAALYICGQLQWREVQEK